MTATLSARSSSNIPLLTLPTGFSAGAVRIAQQMPKVDIAIVVNGNVITTFEAKLATGKSTNATVPLEVASSPKARLKARWSQTLAEANALRQTIPNPVGDLVDFFSSLPGDYATWREIIEEPYG